MGGGFDDSFRGHLAHESWSLYGIGMMLIVLRMFVSIHNSFRNPAKQRTGTLAFAEPDGESWNRTIS